jgi:aryl-alcohol dehydrogenase-like predicted oxidoreductase
MIQLIGEVLKERGKREDVVLATKGTHKLGDGKIINNLKTYEVKLTAEEIAKIDRIFEGC